MINYQGIAVESLYKVDNNNYATARDAFVLAVTQRQEALNTHSTLINSQTESRKLGYVRALPELDTKSSKICRHHGKVRDHLVNLHKLQEAPVDLSEALDESEADTLMTYLLPLLPDLGVRKVLDEDGLKMYVLETAIRDNFNGSMSNSEEVADFMQKHKDSFDFSPSDGDSEWGEIVKEFYQAAIRKSKQNVDDHLLLLYRSGLDIEFRENEAYISGLQVAYLLDLYLLLIQFPESSETSAYIASMGSHLAACLDLLLSAPDPNRAIEECTQSTKISACCLPSFLCKSRDKSEREVQLAKATQKPRVRSFLGLSV